MTNSALTHVYVLLDRSGSMSAIADDTVGGFAAFVREQQSVPGRCRLSLAQFDDVYDRVYAAVDIRDVPPLDLQPRGTTALHDAMVSILTDAVERSVGQQAATLKGEKRSGFRVHARTGLPCPVCGDTVREVSFADKSFQYCPGCQIGGKVLADRRMSRLLK